MSRFLGMQSIKHKHILQIVSCFSSTLCFYGLRLIMFMARAKRRTFFTACERRLNHNLTVSMQFMNIDVHVYNRTGSDEHYNNGSVILKYLINFDVI